MSEIYQRLIETNPAFRQLMEAEPANRELAELNESFAVAMCEITEARKNLAKDAETLFLQKAINRNRKTNDAAISKSLVEFKSITNKPRPAVEMVDKPQQTTYKPITAAPIRKETEEMNKPKVNNAMTKNTASGGYLLSEELFDKIIHGLNDHSAMFELSEIVPVTENSLLIPIDNGDTESTAGWTSEGTTIGDFSPAVSQIVLTPSKLACVSLVSEETAYDSRFDVEQYIAASAGYHLGAIAEDSFLNGTVSGQPTGILTQAAAVTSSVTASFNAADLIGLFAGVKEPYRKNGTWLISDDALETIIPMKDENGNHIYQPAAQAGEPDRILGRPVRTSSKMPEPGTGSAAVAFGDFNFYKIGLKNLKVQVLKDVYAGAGQVGYFTTMYLDGKLAADDAVKTLICL